MSTQVPDATATSDLASPDLTGDSTLHLTEISKSFRTRTGELVQALSPMSLEVSPGETVSILGPSGCGKTTLLMIAAGLERPTTGRVSLGNSEVVGPHPALGIAFQRDCLLEWRNVRDNILLQTDLRGWKRSHYLEQVATLLAMVGLAGYERQYPRELSGGMRQRVALCRALVHEPRVLLLDEPFAALDALTRERLNTDVATLCAAWNPAVLFVTHDIDEAVFMADRVVVMASRPGRVMEIVDVPFPRPRDLSIRAEARFTALVARVRKILVSSGAYQL